MENKNRGYHVTIVDNNTGETVRDFDTNAINYVALEDTAKGKRIMEERKPFVTRVRISRPIRRWSAEPRSSCLRTQSPCSYIPLPR